MALLYIERSPRLTEHPNTQRYHDHGISKQRFQQQEGNKFLSLLHLGKSLKNQAGKLSFISQFRLTGFVKQVVLLWVQNSFCPLKSDLPDCYRSGAINRCFALRKEDVLKENEPTKGNYSYKHTYYKHLGYPVVCFQLLQFIYSSNSAI